MSDSGLSINGPKTLRGSLVLVVLAIGLTGYGAYDYVDSTSAVRDAAEVDATIVETGVETTSVNRRGGVEYRPTAKFNYSYEGQAYTGTNIFPGSVTPTYDTEAAARDVLSGYQPNTTVTAYVDPATPDNAFLNNRVSNTPYILVGIGLLMTLMGLVSAKQNY